MGANKVYKNIKNRIIEQARLNSKYQFINRQKGNKKLLYVLSGYKPFLWDLVFSRINKFVAKDIDVCIISSGLFSKDLDKICRKYQWSYLSTSRNKLTIAQNIAINLHKNAQFIFKMDEDMFICKDFFSILENTYNYVQENDRYYIGFVGPLIPLNTYGRRFLEKTNNLVEYEQKFGKFFWGGSVKNHPARKNPKTAVFMWDKTGQIDALAYKLANSDMQYSICPVRYNIGAILFTRETWEDMGMFLVGEGSGAGFDEDYLMGYCMINSKAGIIAENALAGHFGFGEQEDEMKRYLKRHPDFFKIAETNSMLNE